jgi:hypothetical protein
VASSRTETGYSAGTPAGPPDLVVLGSLMTTVRVVRLLELDYPRLPDDPSLIGICANSENLSSERARVYTQPSSVVPGIQPSLGDRLDNLQRTKPVYAIAVVHILMVRYSCDSCDIELDFYRDVYELTSTETETKEGLIRTKEVETEHHEGWACAYCDAELPELVGKNLNRQFSALQYLSGIKGVLDSMTSHGGRVKVEE